MKPQQIKQQQGWEEGVKERQGPGVVRDAGTETRTQSRKLVPDIPRTWSAAFINILEICDLSEDAQEIIIGLLIWSLSVDQDTYTFIKVCKFVFIFIP